MLKEHRGVCHICGHPGATQVDHTPSRKELLRLGLDPNNPRYLRPAHGGKSGGCPYCPTVDGRPRRCNQRKGVGPVKPPPPALITSRPW